MRLVASSLCTSHRGSFSVWLATVCVEVTMGALVCGYSLCRSQCGSSSEWLQFVYKSLWEL